MTVNSCIFYTRKHIEYMSNNRYPYSMIDKPKMPKNKHFQIRIRDKTAENKQEKGVNSDA